MREACALFPANKKGTYLTSQEGIMPAELITADELATRLRIRPHTVRSWTRDGKIPAVRLSAKVIRYDLGAVIELLTQDSQAKGAN